jgi:hypothetical protein
MLCALHVYSSVENQHAEGQLSSHFLSSTPSERLTLKLQFWEETAMSLLMLSTTAGMCKATGATTTYHVRKNIH